MPTQHPYSQLHRHKEYNEKTNQIKKRLKPKTTQQKFSFQIKVTAKSKNTSAQQRRRPHQNHHHQQQQQRAAVSLQ